LEFGKTRAKVHVTRVPCKSKGRRAEGDVHAWTVDVIWTVMLLSGSHGFLLDGERAREEKGDMTFLRPLRVVAIFAGLAVVGAACTTEDDESSLSGSQSASQSTSDSSGGSSGANVTTTDAPASSSGGEVSTSEPSTTGPNPTTTDPTTGSGTTTGDTTSGTTGNTGGCGDGVINGNEQCDGANLNGFTCEALGNAGGTLLCDAVTCTFDTQMCEVGGSGGTSG